MNRRQTLVAIIAILWSLLACALTAAPPTVGDGDSFTLMEGDSAVLSGDDTRLTFVDVVEDTRCPIEAECVTAGEVTVRVELREDEGTTQHDLTLRSGDAYVSADGNFVTVLLYAVEPYPSVENDPDAPSTATFVMLGPECCAPQP